jgi:hypothetical protein
MPDLSPRARAVMELITYLNLNHEEAAEVAGCIAADFEVEPDEIYDMDDYDEDDDEEEYDW